MLILMSSSVKYIFINGIRENTRFPMKLGINCFCHLVRNGHDKLGNCILHLYKILHLFTYLGIVKQVEITLLEVNNRCFINIDTFLDMVPVSSDDNVTFRNPACQFPFKWHFDIFGKNRIPLRFRKMTYNRNPHTPFHQPVRMLENDFTATTDTNMSHNINNMDILCHVLLLYQALFFC